MPIVVSSTVSVSHPEPAPVVAQPQVQEAPVQEAEAQTRGTPDPIPPSKDHPDLECKLHTHEWTYPEMKQHRGHVPARLGRDVSHDDDRRSLDRLRGHDLQMSHVHSDKDWVRRRLRFCGMPVGQTGQNGYDGPWARGTSRTSTTSGQTPRFTTSETCSPDVPGGSSTGSERSTSSRSRSGRIRRSTRAGGRLNARPTTTSSSTPPTSSTTRAAKRGTTQRRSWNRRVHFLPADAQGRSNGRYAGKAYGTGSKHMHPNHHTEAVTPDLYYCPTLGSGPRSRGNQWGRSVIASNPSGICKTESELSTTNWITTRSRYNFDVHDPGDTLSYQRGVFIFAGRSEGKWKAYYIGYTTEPLSSITTSHEKWPDARAAGATHIHTLIADTLGHGKFVACELIREFAPPLNEQCK